MFRRPLPAAIAAPARSFSLNWLHGILAAAPLCFVAIQVASWVRNVPNWDEFDTVLDFLIALDDGDSALDFAQRLFAVSNEHRTVVSRLMFAASYWVTGGINFAALALLGNLFLAGAVAVTVAQATDAASRWRLAPIVALVVFQLQHHENLFWAGASIDHFFVVFAAVTALAAINRTGRASFAVACAAAVLATFSLAHGLMVWPVAGIVLLVQRRMRTAARWAGVGVVSVAVYFAGFHLNAGHAFPGFGDAARVLVFWFTLIGSSPALDNVALAPWYGALHVAVMLFLLARRCQPRDHFALAVVAWCLGSMALIAWGRALGSSEWVLVTSRYVILSSVAWALLIGVAVERALARQPARPWWLSLLFLALVGFNVRANDAYAAAGRVHAQNMERAALCFHRDGTFTRAPVPVYPDAERADALLRDAEARDIVELPPIDALDLAKVTRVELDHPREIDGAVYCIDEFEADESAVHVRGWAFRPDEPTRLGRHSVLFRTADGVCAFQAFSQLRPDVAEAYERPDAIHAGFELRIPWRELPRGELLAVGICFDDGNDAEFIMTAHTVAAEPAAPAFAAKN